MKSMKFIETVLPKLSSVLVLAAIMLSTFTTAKANLYVFGADGKLVKKVELQADLTGNPIGGLTPTGKITSDYFAGTQALLFERTQISNLNLPDTVTGLNYFLNNSTTARASVSRFSQPNVWGSTFLFGGLSRIAIGSTVQVKNENSTVLSGIFTRPIRNFEPFDTALVGRFTVPATPSTFDVGGLAEVQFFPAQNRLRIDAAISNLAAQECTQITLNEGAVGQNGPVVASLTTLTGQVSSEYYCSAEGEVILTEQQVVSLRSGNLYVVGLSNANPNGVRRGQLESSVSNGDFTGDGKADISVYRPSTSTWYIQDSNSNQYTSFNLGSTTSKSVAADYDGDSKSDAAVFEPATGVWSVRKSTNNLVKQVQWGTFGDIALSGKHFGTANDLVVFRPSNGTWYIRRFGDIIKPVAQNVINNNSLNFQSFKWGQAEDKPVMADFNGDGRDELAVFRPSNGVWYIYNQITGTNTIRQFGIAEDIPVAADYDGDGKADIAVFRPSTGTWYIWESGEQKFTARQFGLRGDIPTVADFDKDGVADISVFRPTNGNWYRLNSSSNSFNAFNFGTENDVPAVR
jgi:CHRD domain/FG-GAP-like repeat